MNATPTLAGRARAAWTGACVALFAVALGLRVWGTGFGLPYLHHWDEPHVINQALRMARTGSLDPWSYNYPALWYWVQALGLKLADWTVPGFDLRSASVLADHQFHYWWNAQPEVYRWARWQAALWSAATVWAAASAARAAAGTLAGLTAGALLTVMPHHLYFSRFAQMDAPAGLFVALALRGLAGATAAGTIPLAVWVCGGLAAAMKYPLIVLPAAVLAAAGRPDRARLRRAAAGVLLGFTLGHPFWILKPSRVLGDLQMLHGAYGTWQETSYRSHFGNLLEGCGPAAAALAAVGLGLARGPAAPPARAGAAFAGLLIGLLGAYPVSVARNLAPIFPAAAILAGIGAAGLARPARPWAGATAAFLVVAVTAITSHRHAWERFTPDQRDHRSHAMAWIAEHLPQDRPVLVDAEILIDASELPARPPALVAHRFAWTPETFRRAGIRHALVGAYETADASADAAYRAFPGPGGRLVKAWPGAPVRLRWSEPLINPDLRLVTLPSVMAPPAWGGFPLTPPGARAGRVMLAPGASLRWEIPLPPGRWRLRAEARAAAGAGRARLRTTGGTLGAAHTHSDATIVDHRWAPWVGPSVTHRRGRVEWRLTETDHMRGLEIRHLRAAPVWWTGRSLD